MIIYILPTNSKKILTVFVLLAAFVSPPSLLYWQAGSQGKTMASEIKLMDQATDAKRAVMRYRSAKASIAKLKEEGINITVAEKSLEDINKLIQTADYKKARTQSINVYNSSTKQLADWQAEQAKYGDLFGRILDSAGKPLANAVVEIIKDSAAIVSVNSSSDGAYSIQKLLNGDYSVRASLSGYVAVTKQNIRIESLKTSILDIALNRYVPPAPKPAPVPVSNSASSPYASYSKQTISTDVGTFSANIITINLDNPAIKVATDTGNSEDCTNNCPVKSLSAYNSANSGFAAINGTYFCPADYSSCAGKTGWYFWRVYNSRLGKMFNANDAYTQDDPLLAFDTSNKPHFFRNAKDFSLSNVQAAIAGSELVYGNAVTVNVGKLDEKQKTVKSSRGAIGVKGNTAYLVIGSGATVIDMAHVMKGLGVDYALNLDGGGSSTMMYSGSYKVGPGRSIPNAIIFGTR